MGMPGPVAALLGDGARLHLSHGPIDLIIGADAVQSGGRQRAFAAAAARFEGLLEGLVAERPLLSAPLHPTTPTPKGAVARRMYKACQPHCAEGFVTCMAAVAGSVADEILAAMVVAEPLLRAYVNNGGDIAIHLAPGARFITAMAGVTGADLGRITLDAADGVGGMATSGAGGRSHSFGIASSVTVLAASAAQADVAATLIANAVDVPDHSGIRRSPAHDLQPDSDLGGRMVVTHIPPLTRADQNHALSLGANRAEAMLRQGQIAGAALFLQDEQRVVGTYFGQNAQLQEANNVET
ncbi:hypothetical protein SAMN05216227_103923 [Pseudorhodobacter antarcticus]|jgi:ApbE superfamily uncharacterized protein (UPF0280 family)|uniref:Uncharacterized protein n=2 Tax=Pseudorhodobacter antarcticus TaxID=1077947 RepID=A0A1H8L7Z3_9RHOB|nr:hypothetical protein SAMN05216227_103923 [Pseudorhodobacter antarcticus]